MNFAYSYKYILFLGLQCFHHNPLWHPIYFHKGLLSYRYFPLSNIDNTERDLVVLMPWVFVKEWRVYERRRKTS